MAIDNSIIFGGVNSADFGIYISGEGVFNAPERDVEMIEIPGRNGALALDKGRFKNISVTYPAFNYEPNDYDTFAERLADFRNAICSQRGYQRLEDTFHPDEYRMAAYVEGLEIKPIKYNTASEFDITFDCKPQRWLKSGETAVTVASGDTLTNPTLFESSPLLEIEGYGNIQINEDTLSVSSRGTAAIRLFSTKNWNGESYSLTQSVEFNDEILLAGDRIYSDRAGDNICEIGVVWDYDDADIISENVTTTGYAHWTRGFWYGTSFRKSEVYFEYGTAQTFTGTSTFTFTSSTYGSLVGTISLSLAYDGIHTITISASYTTPPHFTEDMALRGLQLNTMFADASSLNKTYIDLDIGEAYGILGDEWVTYNDKVSFPSDLPTLASGANTITFDNTITDLKVTPRWWKI